MIIDIKESDIMDNKLDVHDVVKQRYGGVASGTQASCCGASDGSSDCGCNVNLYDSALVQDLPVDVTGLSLG